MAVSASVIFAVQGTLGFSDVAQVTLLDLEPDEPVSTEGILAVVSTGVGVVVVSIVAFLIEVDDTVATVHAVKPALIGTVVVCDVVPVIALFIKWRRSVCNRGCKDSVPTSRKGAIIEALIVLLLISIITLFLF